MNHLRLLSATLIAVLATACTATGERDTARMTSDGQRAGTTGATSGMAGTGGSTSGMSGMAGGSGTQPVERGTDGSAAGAQGDGLALAMLSAINEHEVAASRAAAGKQLSAPVARYAQMMVTEHTANQAKVASLGQPRANAEVQALKTKKAAERAAMARLEGQAFERAYVEAMVKDHGEALAAIDGKLLPAASSGPVRQHLTQTRAAVARHLEEARGLQGAR